MNESEKYKILIVDDSAMNRTILADILENEYDILEAGDGVEAIQLIKKHSHDISLILLDLVMPNMDGLEVLNMMNKANWINDIPVIMISQESSPAFVESAYNLGATDFISRPFNVSVVRKRVANTIVLYTKQKKLINLVSQQVFEKERMNNLMITILSHIVEFRNGESGLHILHVNTITDVLLRQLMQKTDKYNIGIDDIDIIVTASSLHDIGKISIPDEILNKPGKLTPKEYEIVKGHSKAGFDMLSAMTEHLTEPLVKTACDICLYHHERYDGKGYPNGLSGDEIPISAQIVSIADVYDALTSERCYKKAYSHTKAIEMIENGECGTFNPLLLECLNETSDYLEKELKVNSISQNRLNQIKKATKTMLSKNQFSDAIKSINYLEQARIKYEFFASMTQEIQFEYTSSPSILTISDWCAEKFGLPSVIVNPLENEKLISVLGGAETFRRFKEKFDSTTIQKPISNFLIKLNINNQQRYHKVFFRADWNDSGGTPKLVGAIGKLIDIEDDRQKMLSLKKKASTDYLTDIYNRDYCERLSKELLANGKGRNFALMIIDLDDFKIANNVYGHMFGDTVLKKLGEMLKECTRKEDIVARIGGDEFVVFFEYSTEQAYKSVSNRIFNFINKTQCGLFNITISVGSATTKQTGYDYDRLFVCADTALYHSKRNGKGSHTFYDKSMPIMNQEITPAES